MDSIEENFSSKKFVIIIILISLFLGAAFYVYNTYIAPRLNPKFVSNREFTQQETIDNTELYFIFADWCPYSKKVIPIWNSLKEKYNRKKVNKFAVIFTELDGDKNEKEIYTYRVTRCYCDNCNTSIAITAFNESRKSESKSDCLSEQSKTDKPSRHFIRHR